MRAVAPSVFSLRVANSYVLCGGQTAERRLRRGLPRDLTSQSDGRFTDQFESRTDTIVPAIVDAQMAVATCAHQVHLRPR